MNSIAISQAALLIFWFMLAMLIFVLALIARFYESNSGQPTYFRWYAAPIVLLGVGVVRYVSLNQWGDDPIGDILMFFGGTMLLVLCLRLYFTMTQGGAG